MSGDLQSVLEDQWKRTTPERVRELFDIDSSPILKPNKNRSLALHYAVAFDAPLLTIKALCELNKSALMVQNENGQTPLHYACYNSFQSVPYLLSVAPQAANIFNNNGRLPIHCLIMNSGPLSALAKLIKCTRNPAVGAKDGKTVLHYAAYTGTECLPFVIENYPGLLLVKDREGQVPIHVALMCDCKLSVLKQLYFASKESIFKQDKDFENSPLHYAVVNDNREALNFFLTECPFEVTRVKNVHGRTPFDLAKHYQRKELIKMFKACSGQNRPPPGVESAETRGGLPKKRGPESTARVETKKIKLHEEQQTGQMDNFSALE